MPNRIEAGIARINDKLKTVSEAEQNCRGANQDEDMQYSVRR